jgi:S1-C subfamily serine protease
MKAAVLITLIAVTSVVCSAQDPSVVMPGVLIPPSIQQGLPSSQMPTTQNGILQNVPAQTGIPSGVQIDPQVKKLEDLKANLTSGELKNAVQNLTPQQVQQLKTSLGISSDDLQNISVDRIAYWARQAQSVGIDWQSLPEADKAQIVKMSQQRLDQQRVIDANNAPFQLVGNALKKLPGYLYPDGLTPATPKSILMAAQSVGKIVISDGSLFGTGWVIKDGVIATNCHVALQLLGAGQGDIPPGTLIDFSGSDAIDKTQAFTISGVLFLSQEKGLDIALLEISTASIGTGAPPPVPLHISDLKSLPVSGYFVGYASGAQGSASFETDQLATAISRVGKSAKISSTATFSAEMVFADFAVLLHDASTQYGSSGSPLLDTTGSVVGIHDCCNSPADFVGGGSCASTTAVTPFNNQSIASSSFMSVPDLKRALSTQ